MSLEDLVNVARGWREVDSYDDLLLADTDEKRSDRKTESTFTKTTQEKKRQSTSRLASLLGGDSPASPSSSQTDPSVDQKQQQQHQRQRQPRLDASQFPFAHPKRHHSIDALQAIVERKEDVYAAVKWNSAAVDGWGALMSQVSEQCGALKDAYAEELQNCTEKKMSLPIIASLRKASRKSTAKGRLIYERFMENFNVFQAKAKNLKISSLQYKVIRAVANALIPQMYGEDFDSSQVDIKERLGFDRFVKAVLAEFPRRWGKTYCASMIEASCLDAIGGGSAIIAAYLRQAQYFLSLVKMFFMMLPNAESRVLVDNKDEFRVRPTYMSSGVAGAAGCNLGWTRAFSSMADSSRGLTVSRVYYDEASFVRKEHILSNAFANMMVKNTVVMMISSPPTSHDNVFYQLTLFDDLFSVIHEKLLCDECHSKREIKCPHIVVPSPPWLSDDVQKKAIERTLGVIDPRRYRQEILGLPEDPNINVFDHNLLNMFKNNPRVTVKTPLDTIYVSFDISCGGGNTESDTGVLVGWYDERSRFVVWSSFPLVLIVSSIIVIGQI